MALNDGNESPVFLAEYNSTNGTENLVIDVTGDSLSISVAIKNENVIKGIRFYSTSDTN